MSNLTLYSLLAGWQIEGVLGIWILILAISVSWRINVKIYNLYLTVIG